MFYGLTAVWGFAQGAHIANLLAVMCDFCGADQMALLFGIVLLAEGLGSITGTPLCGTVIFYFIDPHGSHG